MQVDVSVKPEYMKIKVIKTKSFLSRNSSVFCKITSGFAFDTHNPLAWTSPSVNKMKM